MINIKIAGLAVEIDNIYPNVEYIAKDYLTEEKTLFSVSVNAEDIKAERDASATSYKDAYYESTAIYRKIAEKLPEYDGFLFHGSVIELNGVAYVITAHSGVGKTTHTGLWLSEFGDEVSIINGDKPIIRFIDGVPYACGTPWMGKEGYGKNDMKPLGGFVFLSRGEKNKAAPITPSDAVTRFMSQIYLPKKNKMNLLKTMQLADRVIKSSKLINLECNMDKEAAHVCRAAIENEND